MLRGTLYCWRSCLDWELAVSSCPSTPRSLVWRLLPFFVRYYKALTRTNPVTYCLESLYPSGTEREEETYSQVKHHIDKSFCPSNLEESMLSGINKRAGMVATSRLLRQTGDTTGKVEGGIRKRFAATLARDPKHAKYGTQYVPCADMLRHDDFGIWLIQNCDLWIRCDELGLTGVSIVKELEVEYQCECGAVRGLEINLSCADDEGVMARYSSWNDDRESLMQYIIRKIFRPYFWDKPGVFVPSWGEAKLRRWIKQHPVLLKRLGIVEGGNDSWVDSPGAGGSGSGSCSNSSGEVDIDSESVSAAVLEEEERQRQEVELGQDEAMARLLTEQDRALGGEIRKRVEAMDADEDLGDQSSSGNSGGVARAIRCGSRPVFR